MANTYATDDIATVTVSNTVNVNTSPVVLANVVNEYNEFLCPSNTPTTIVSYTVPSGKTLLIKSVIGWGEADGEFLLYVDGVLKGGGRTSAAERTKNLLYAYGPVVATAGQVVTVKAEQNELATETMRANLMGELI
jgi:hypothetical protein